MINAQMQQRPRRAGVGEALEGAFSCCGGAAMDG